MTPAPTPAPAAGDDVTAAYERLTRTSGIKIQSDPNWLAFTRDDFNDMRTVITAWRAARDEAAALRAAVGVLFAELDRLKAFINSQAERMQAMSESLTRAAERAEVRDA